jgi:hypothetical protein
MGRVRSYLPSILESMRSARTSLALHVVIVDPQFAFDNFAFFEREHGRNAVRDNRTFFSELYSLLERQPDVEGRVRLSLYQGFPSFAAVVADGPRWGSSMIAQNLIPRAREGSFDYPRFKLRHRTERGLYPTYWNSIQNIIERSPRIINGRKDLSTLLEDLEGGNRGNSPQSVGI